MRPLDGVVLKRGSHSTPEDGMCAMEAVAWMANEPHSDKPVCACPVIASVLRSWNDGMGSDDETRTRIISPLLSKVIGTRVPTSAAGDAVLLKRMYLVVDWQIRVYAPAFLRAAGLNEAADSLALLPEVNNNERLMGALQPSSAAWSAARSAARSAAESAARSAAESAAWSAARSAARSAAERAACSAACNAAESAAERAACNAAWNAAERAARSAAERAACNAAWNAAESAAWNAAERAVESALAPTVNELQASMAALVVRMCEVTE